MLSRRNFYQVNESGLSESTDDETSCTGDTSRPYSNDKYCQHSVDESVTESDSIVDMDDDNDWSIAHMSPPSQILKMGPPPPPRISTMKKKRGPYRTHPKLKCKTTGCSSLTTSARSKFCLRHKEARRRIRNQCIGAVACTFPVPGTSCKLTPFRDELCQKHHRIMRIRKKG